MSVGKDLANLWITVGVNPANAYKGFGSLKKAAGSFLGEMGGAALGFGAALGAAFGVEKVVEEFIKGEQSLTALSSALATSGQDVDGNMSKFKALAGELEQFTRVEDDVTFGLLKVATNMGIPANEAGNLAKAAIGLSQALGVDSSTAMTMLGKESLGMKTKLEKMIPALKGVTDQQERLRIITEMSQKGFLQEQAMAGTLGGRLQQLWNQVGNLAESIGGLLAPALMFGVDLLQTFIGIVQGVMDHFAGAGVSMTALGELVKGYFTTVWTAAAKVVTFFGDIVVGIAEPVGGAINAIAGFIMDLYEKATTFGMHVPEMWQQWGESTQGIFTQVGAVFSWLGEKIGSFVSWAAEGIAGFVEDVVFTFSNMDLVIQEVGITLTNWAYAITDTFSWITETIGSFGVWFYQNFQDIWPTVLDYSLTALANWGQNIRTVFSEVLDYIKSGFRDPIDLSGLKKTTEGAQNYLKKGFKVPEYKDSFDAGKAREDVAKEWDVRRKEWDNIVKEKPPEEAAPTIDPLTAVKAATGKEKKEKTESGQFSELGNAFKAASTGYQKEQDKMAKEALKLQKKQVELQEREVEALENLSLGLD